MLDKSFKEAVYEWLSDPANGEHFPVWLSFGLGVTLGKIDRLQEDVRSARALAQMIIDSMPIEPLREHAKTFLESTK